MRRCPAGRAGSAMTRASCWRDATSADEPAAGRGDPGCRRIPRARRLCPDRARAERADAIRRRAAGRRRAPDRLEGHHDRGAAYRRPVAADHLEVRGRDDPRVARAGAHGLPAQGRVLGDGDRREGDEARHVRAGPQGRRGGAARPEGRRARRSASPRSSLSPDRAPAHARTPGATPAAPRRPRVPDRRAGAGCP